MKRSKPNIPPGAPGHPRVDGAPGPGRAGARAGSKGGGGKKARWNRGESVAEPRGEARRGPVAESGRPYAPAHAPRPVGGEGARPGFHAKPRAASRPRAVEFLYEDEDLIAVDKPAGLPVIAPEGSRARCLYDIVTDKIREKNPRGRAALVHRIDRDTSGLVVFAKDGRTKKLLMEGWDELVRSRIYLALVEGEMEGASGRLDSWLAENRGGQVYETGPGERGAKRAVARWRLLGSGKGLSLLELSLETGRKHQIRVQLASAGHPVIGDPRYGSSRDDLGRLGLHAFSIEIAMPSRELPLKLECPAPSEFGTAVRVIQARGDRS